MPQFIEEWVEDTARHRILRQTGLLESEWPAYSAGAIGSACKGYWHSADEGCSCLLSVPSSRWFKPRTLWIRNSTGKVNEVNFYVGGSGASCSSSLGLGMFLPAWDTQFIALDCITVGGDLWISTLYSGIGIKIGGVLLTSGPE